MSRSSEQADPITGIRLRELLEENGITQKELADELGVKGVTVSRYAYSKRKMDIVTLTKIARIFNVSTDYLTGITNKYGGREEPKGQE